jgi:hypothetical protein
VASTTVLAQHHDTHHARPPAPGPESEIRRVHADMRAAAEQRDAAALFAFVLDTATPPIIENGAIAATHAAALERTERGLRGLASISYAYARDSITVLSPTTALWVAEGTAQAGLPDGRQISAPFAESIVFVRRDGAWKVLHAHRSSPRGNQDPQSGPAAR